MRRKAELWPLPEARQSFHDVTQEAPSRKRRITRNNRWAELKHKRILVVEDEPMQALHLATMIEDLAQRSRALQPRSRLPLPRFLSRPLIAPPSTSTCMAFSVSEWSRGSGT